MEIIPGRLSFDPEKGAASGFVDGLHLCDIEGAGPRGYTVTHYSKEACGRASGPLDLEHTIRFCRALEKRLIEHEKQEMRLVLTSTRHDSAAHTNIAVLLGAYLILRLGWSVESVLRSLGSATSERRIPCSWAKNAYQKKHDIMQVHHCWLGFEAARKHSWITATCFSDDSAADLSCSQYKHMVTTYDASWVVPEKLLICADPTTTAADPNPRTFSRLFGCHAQTYSPSIEALDLVRMISETPPPSPTRKPAEKRSTSKVSISPASQFISISPATLPLALKESSLPKPQIDEEPFHRVISPASADFSTATVCKNYAYSAESTSTGGPFQAGHEALPFSGFLRKHNVAVVVRANFEKEPGMVTRSYDAKELQEYNIDHVDLPFPDWGEGGAVPPGSVCAELLDSMQGHLDSEHAICVHCKGGFGRSALLLCILAIHHYDVSGGAMLGWIRVARPGAVTTVQQEEFLCTLQGRASLKKFIDRGSGQCCVLQ
eukprot:TRINITY_DN3948_c1_g2_i1.p1 TRINITY_DN3948_c1_g2~~TRINITY_DN3948_c1_g2_i1.p1  ORF type:complete len:489 (-),score=67.80 TRINITY_DN3948_c1_g2_i1:544-2010(-)